jgi:hypothetical protein
LTVVGRKPILTASKERGMNQTSQLRRFLRKWWPVAGAGIVMLGLVGLFGLVWFIESSANAEARAAQREFPGDKVEALVQSVQSERHTLHERNRAVWALGRLRDPRALPVLRKYYTGGPCHHDTLLCQSELRKAIALCNGTTTAPGWLETLMRWSVARS